MLSQKRSLGAGQTDNAAERTDLSRWLGETLPHGPLETLRWVIKKEAAYPGRPELHARLAKIEEAARLIRDEVRKLEIRALLLNGDPIFLNQNETYHGLGDIADRAARVRAQNPPHRGRGWLYPKNATGPSDRDLCALIVMIAWKRHAADWPKNNAAMHEACAALWLAAGGKSIAPSRGADGHEPVSAWRAHMKTAADKYLPPHPAGRIIENFFENTF